MPQVLLLSFAFHGGGVWDLLTFYGFSQRNTCLAVVQLEGRSADVLSSHFGWLNHEISIIDQTNTYPIYTDEVTIEIFPKHSYTLPVEG